MSEPLLSVLSCVYNQENYIEDMLNGFLNQEVDFEVEYIIHDDASTDRTPEILRKYQNDYPGKFNVIYQTENQWSQHIKIAQQILLPMARGKYIAFCEGDDYWIDKNKLKEQIAFLEANQDYVCVSHNALIWHCDKNLLYAQNNCECSRELLAKDIITRKWPSIATASRVFRKEAVILNGFFLDCGMVGDMPTDFYAFSQGRIYYIDKIMSVYRFKSQGSWTKKTVRNLRNLLEWRIVMVDFLKKYNEYTNYQYELYVQSYMSRGVHDILDILIDEPMAKTEFINLLHEISDKTNYKYENIINELESLASMLVYGDNLDFFQNLREIAVNKKIFLYGAGRFGKVMAQRLIEKNIEFEGFLVTKQDRTENSVMNKKIWEIDSYENHDSHLILVCVSGKIWDEIYEILEQNHIKNYMYPLLVNDRGK